MKKSDIYDNSRKTMLFNERTDRSLNAELSQLDKNRKEIMRDLRKIKQIKSALQEQLKSVLDKTPAPGARLEMKLSGRHDVRLPAVETKERRPRFHSDMGPLNNLIAKEKRRVELKAAKSEAALKPMVEQSQQMEPDFFGHSKNRGDRARMENEYRTNQELRNELMIKSRFHQVGSKYVGKEIFDKKHHQKKQQRRADDSCYSKRSSVGKTPLRMHLPDGVEEQKVTQEGGLSANFSSLSIIRNDDSEQAVANDTENQLASNIATVTGRMEAQPRLHSSLPLHSDQSVGTDTEAQLRGNAAGLGQGGLSVARRFSTTSTGVLERDVFHHKAKHDPMLPSIPLEFRSNRQDRGPNSLARAFMVCQQMNSDSCSLKSERKRRFANLVDLVIKQRKVIHAWEPILNTVGDIQSDDEV